MSEDYHLTISEVAERIGMTISGIRHAIRQGRLKAKKEGYQYLISVYDLKNYMETKKK